MSVFSNFTETAIHLSRCLGIKILDEEGRLIGRFKDFFVDYEEVYPHVLAIQYITAGHLFYIDWEDVKSFSYSSIIISSEASLRRGHTFPRVKNRKVITSLLANQFSGTTDEYPAVGRIILDRQIVDTHGKKVVRVNDIQLIKIGQQIRVTHAEVGLRSMIWRLGYGPLVDRVVKICSPHAKYLKNDVVINWKYVHAIPDKSVQRNVRLTLTNDDLKELHPADLADILENLDSHGRDYIFSALSPELAALTLSELEEGVQLQILKGETPEDVAEILENMGTDEAADILGEMQKEQQEEIIAKINDSEIKDELHELLEYEEDTAGGLMSTEVFQVLPTDSKSSIMAKIQEEYDEIDSMYDIYVTDHSEKLIGVYPLNKLLIQKNDLVISTIMNDEDIKSVKHDAHWKEVATLMSKYNLITLPVIDDQGLLLGIVSVDDVLPWLLGER